MIFDPKYAQLCSEKTLQANQEGFFMQFVRNVTEDAGEKWVRNVFGKLKSDGERIRRVYQDDKVRRNVIGFLSNVQEIYRRKSGEVARKRFDEAEIARKNGELVKALNLYNQSVLKAPQNDLTSNLALFSRAKTLISLNEFASALSDLQLSLKQKLDASLKFEAFSMMAVCYKALKEEQKSKISLNLAEKLTENPQLLAQLHKSMEIEYRPIEKRVKLIPPISGRSHASLKHASAKLTVKHSPESGRFVVSNEAIKSGETLVVEKPEVACLLPEKFGTHCHHCFDRFLAPVGCPDCASVVFCSQDCQKEAAYHKFECKFLDLLIGSGMSVLSLAALRAVTQRTLNQCEQLYKNKIELCTNAAMRKPEDFLQRTLMAAFLLRCLQMSGFFPKRGDAVLPTEQEYQIGEILLRYLQILQFNAHEIFETLYTKEHKVKGGRTGYIGVAVYPTVSLFNHECYPVVTRHFVGKTIVITSLRPVPPGAVISENYGPIFTHHNQVDRQRVLSARYWFTCQCQACLEDWPLMKDLGEKRVRCQTKDCAKLFTLPVDKTVTCPKCQKTVDLEENLGKLEWAEKQYNVANGLIEKKEVEESLKTLSEALNVFHCASAPPHKGTHLAEESLRFCLADFGNTSDSLIKK